MTIELKNDCGYCRRLLSERLWEPAPGRIQLLTGPRQVGKTTLLLQLAHEFGEAAIYMAGDEPDAVLPGRWERCWTEAEARAARYSRPAAGRACVMCDSHLPSRGANPFDYLTELQRHAGFVDFLALAGSRDEP